MNYLKKTKINRSRIIQVTGLLSWLVFFLAVSHPPISAQTFIQSYSSDSQLQQGLIVQLSQNNSHVIAASQDKIYQTFGVVVNASDAPVAFSTNSGTQGSQAFVASNGQYNVLVSDQNGAITTGNYITISSVDGVGMKDNTTSPIVVAQALGSFDGKTNTIGSDSLKTTNGKGLTVHYGLIKANISIGHNPLINPVHTSIPSVLQKFSTDISGKNNSSWKIYLSLVILSAVAILTGTMLYSAVRNSFIAIGRNPLSKNAIKAGFVRVVVSAFIIFISGIFGVYLLLKA